MLATKTVVHVADMAAEPAYFEQSEPGIVAAVEIGRIRTLLAVPMLKGESELVGAVILSRPQVRPFTDKQIELVRNFAAQAVIAIENARLLNELRQRTDDLTESLEQQTATSEVLKVISGSPGDLQPVFTTMLENAVRICDARFGYTLRRAGDVFDQVATYNVPLAFAEARWGLRIPAKPGTPLGRILATKTTVHVADVAADPIYTEERDPAAVSAVELGGVRTLLAVPMLKENEPIGAFAIYRQEVRPFTDKQIELVTNFAAQAVIAIENTRLLNELRERTTDLTESLEQQTATAEVLTVISSSPGDLDPVFRAMLENAIRLCQAKFGTMFLYDGEGVSHCRAARCIASLCRSEKQNHGGSEPPSKCSGRSGRSNQ
jgi:GAF domain-containing protein